MLELITENNAYITLIIAIGAGLFAFIKWLDSRNLSLKNERYKSYMQLIRVLSGSKTNDGQSVCMTEQIAAVWFLLEYREYYDITLKILDNGDLEKMSNKNWQELVAPQVRLLIEEIKKRSA